MDYCFKCGKSNKEVSMFDAISKDGLVKICPACQRREELPIVKRPTSSQIQESERRQSVHEKLSGMSGDKKELTDERIKSLRKRDVSLRDIVEENMKKKEGDYKKRAEERVSPKNLIDNYNWIVTRNRRKEKVTKRQLAEEIGESESAIDMVERGYLPSDYQKILKKIESYLGIRVFNETKEEDVREEKPKEKNERTVYDLRDIRRKEEEKKKAKEEEKNREREEKQGVSEEGEVELSDSEMDELLYGE